MVSDARLTGVETPDTVRLPALHRGDLLMRVLLPENHSLVVGAKVMYRGMATGEIRAISLVPTGSHVSVSVRIGAKHRSTVTDTSVFWVAKPELGLKFSWSNPVSVNELGSLLRPHIAYFTPPLGVPLSDGDVVAAHLKRPDIEIPEVPKSALRKPVLEHKPDAQGPVILVRVVYAAVDVDWLSPNDTLHREGTGVLFLDSNNQPSVVTARSTCDATYYHNETFGWKEITNERIRVQLSDGRALTASRSWVDKDGSDIAVLRVEGLPRDHPTSKLSVFSYGKYAPPNSAPDQIHVSGKTGIRMDPTPLALGGADEQQALEALNKLRGGAVMRGETLVGLLGQAGATEAKATVVSLGSLPESLRPTK